MFRGKFDIALLDELCGKNHVVMSIFFEHGSRSDEELQ